MGRNSAAWTVSGAGVAALVGYARSKGVALGDVLAGLGLSDAALALPDTRVNVAAHNAIWDAAAARLGDPDLGLHLAQQLNLDAFHLVGHLASSAGTIGEALERVVAFSRLLHDAGRVELEPGDGCWSLFPGCRGLPAPPSRHIAEFTSASAVLFIRLLTGASAWRPLRVELAFPQPPSVAVHREVFGVLPIFGTAEDRIVLDDATLAMPILRHVPTSIGRYLESYARTLLAQLGTDGSGDIRSQALRIVVTRLAQGAPSLNGVAARLRMTPRTLQRRLSESGDTFASLVETARRASAERYLRDGVLPLAEISALLGFRDPTTFSKAFRRWTGETPGAFRARSR